MLKLAKALKVSVKFLSDDECENPVEDIEKDGYIEDDDTEEKARTILLAKKREAR